MRTAHVVLLPARFVLLHVEFLGSLCESSSSLNESPRLDEQCQGSERALSGGCRTSSGLIESSRHNGGKKWSCKAADNDKSSVPSTLCSKDVSVALGTTQKSRGTASSRCGDGQHLFGGSCESEKKDGILYAMYASSANTWTCSVSNDEKVSATALCTNTVPVLQRQSTGNDASCAADEALLGGGCEVFNGTARIDRSYPLSSTTWRCEAGGIMQVTSFCAKVHGLATSTVAGTSTIITASPGARTTTTSTATEMSTTLLGTGGSTFATTALGDTATSIVSTMAVTSISSSRMASMRVTPTTRVVPEAAITATYMSTVRMHATAIGLTTAMTTSSDTDSTTVQASMQEMQATTAATTMAVTAPTDVESTMVQASTPGMQPTIAAATKALTTPSGLDSTMLQASMQQMQATTAATTMAVTAPTDVESTMVQASTPRMQATTGAMTPSALLQSTSLNPRPGLASDIIREIEQHEGALAEAVAALPAGVVESRQVPGGQAVAVKVASNDNSSEAYVSLEFADASVAVAIPKSAFSTASGRDVVLVMTSLNSSSLGNVLPMEESLASMSGAVSVNIFVDQLTLSVSDLDEPALITIPVGHARSTGARCLYLEEMSAKWSSEGVWLWKAGNGSVMCASKHLTLFAVFGTLAKLQRCSNTEVFTEESMASVASLHWIRHPAGAFLVLSVFVYTTLIIMGARKDRQMQRQYEWRDEFFIVDDENLRCDDAPIRTAARKISLQISTGKQVIKDLHPIRSTANRAFAARRHIFRAAVWICYKISTLILAVETGIGKHIVADIRRRHRHRTASTELVSSSTDEIQISASQSGLSSGTLDSQHALEGLEDRAKTWVSRRHAEFFSQERAATSRFRVSFYIFHPWTFVFAYSVHLPCSLRALLLSSDVFMSMMTSALFFAFNGNDAKSDPDCTTETLIEQLALVFAVNSVAMILGLVPVLVFGWLHSRNLTFVGDIVSDSASRDEVVAAVKRKTKVWAIMDWMLWLSCLSIITANVLYIVAFVANTGDQEVLEWVIGVIFQTSNMLLLDPLLFAGLLSALMAVLAKYPDVIEETRVKLEIDFGLANERKSGDDISQERCLAQSTSTLWLAAASGQEDTPPDDAEPSLVSILVTHDMRRSSSLQKTELGSTSECLARSEGIPRLIPLFVTPWSESSPLGKCLDTRQVKLYCDAGCSCY